MIKAIETRYKGYRFRSRLEARWAVFLDSIGIRWQYESEGFRFDDFSLSYLPDFYLPDWDIYLEIKPDLPTENFGNGLVIAFDEQGHTAIGKFIIAASEMQKRASTENKQNSGEKLRLYMACGTPGIPVVKMVKSQWKLIEGSVVVSFNSIPFKDGFSPMFRLNAFAYTDGGKNLDIWPLYGDRYSASGFNKVKSNKTQPIICVTPLLPDDAMQGLYLGNGIEYNSPNLVKAYRAARSARFEHGETPQ